MATNEPVNPLLIGYGPYPPMPFQLNPYFLTDPLAGIPFVYLFRSHLGNKIPVGMYQDTAGTVKSVSDGDVVKRAVDGLSPVALTQADTAQSFTLRFSADGVPYMETSSADILFENTISQSQPYTLIIAFQQPSPLGGNSAIFGSNSGFVGLYTGSGESTLRGFAGANISSSFDIQNWTVADGFFNGASSRVGGLAGNIGTDGLSGLSLNSWNGGGERSVLDIVAAAVITDDSYTTVVVDYFTSLLPA